MSTEPTPQEKQLAVAISAIRSAVSSLSMALELVGSLQPGKPTPTEAGEDGNGAKFFGGGARVVRPAAAARAEQPRTEED